MSPSRPAARWVEQGAALVDTAVRVVRGGIRHDLLVAVVEAAPPGRPSLRLAARGLSGRNGCLPVDDLDAASTLRA